MNSIHEGLARLVQFLCTTAGSPFLTVLFFTVLAFMISFPLCRKSLNNIPLSALLREDMAAARERHTRHPEKAEAEIMRCFTLRHYGIFASGICTIFQLLLGLILAVGVMGNPLGLDLTVLGLDLTVAPYRYWSTPSGSMLCDIILIAAVGLQFLHDRIVEPELVTEQQTQDMIFLAISAAGCLLLPSIFVLFWLMYEIVELILVLYYVYVKKPPVYKPII